MLLVAVAMFFASDRDTRADRANGSVDAMGSSPEFRIRSSIRMAEAIPYAALALLAIGGLGRRSCPTGRLHTRRRSRLATDDTTPRVRHARFGIRTSGTPRADAQAPAGRARSRTPPRSGEQQRHPAAFLARTGAISLMTFALLIAATAGGRALEGAWPVPPWACSRDRGSRFSRCRSPIFAGARGEAREASARTLGRHANGRRGHDGQSWACNSMTRCE